MKMKFSSIFALTTAILTMLTILTGCAIPAVTSTAASTAVTSAQLPTNYTNAVTADLQLALGILKLEGTANQVDSNTAANLLPLWKAMQALSSSDTTAPAELNAIVKQLVSGMSTTQLQAIAAMQLTSTDLAQVSSPAKTASTTASAGTAVDTNLPADMGANGGAGGPPSGGTMPAGNPPTGSSTGSSTASNSTSSSSGQSTAHLSTSGQVYAMVVQLLTKRAQASA